MIVLFDIIILPYKLSVMGVVSPLWNRHRSVFDSLNFIHESFSQSIIFLSLIFIFLTKTDVFLFQTIVRNTYNMYQPLILWWYNRESISVPYKYTCLEWYSNLGPEHLFLLEFETWWLRPLSHHGQYCRLLCSANFSLGTWIAGS